MQYFDWNAIKVMGIEKKSRYGHCKWVIV